MEYKANKKYFELGEKKDFRSIGGFTKHGLLVAGYNINLGKVPKGMEGCLDDVNAKTKKKKKKESK
tara:strand:- start:70 stop:267 length:198 start_codon:yes stop_codon:yes gene_type:complete